MGKYQYPQESGTRSWQRRQRYSVMPLTDRCVWMNTALKKCVWHWFDLCPPIDLLQIIYSAADRIKFLALKNSSSTSAKPSTSAAAAFSDPYAMEVCSPPPKAAPKARKAAAKPAAAKKPAGEAV